MPDVKYILYGCFSSRTTLLELFSGVITIQVLRTGGKALLQLLHKIWWVIDDNLKRQIKNRTLFTCRLFLPT